MRCVRKWGIMSGRAHPLQPIEQLSHPNCMARAYLGKIHHFDTIPCSLLWLGLDVFGWPVLTQTATKKVFNKLLLA